MTIASSGVTAPSNNPAAPASTSQSASRLASQLDTPQLFIKLLMAELTHQDPTNPTTPSSILQQTSELAQLEAVTAENQSVQKETRYASESAAAGLIGKQVSALVTGKAVSGAVSAITLTKTGTPVLKVGTSSVPLSAITSISAAASISAASSTTGPRA